MNVTRLRLANFKRFTDLTIDLSLCAGAPKLVLLIGGPPRTTIPPRPLRRLADHARRRAGSEAGAPQDVVQVPPAPGPGAVRPGLRLRPPVLLTPARIGPVPDLPPKPQRGREVAVRQGGDRERDEGFGRPVKGVGAAGVDAGRRAIAAIERGAGLPPVAGRGSFDGQHLAEIGPAAVAGRPAGMPGPAGRAAFHVRYSRVVRYSR